jgi:hypothetical protein
MLVSGLFIVWWCFAVFALARSILAYRGWNEVVRARGLLSGPSGPGVYLNPLWWARASRGEQNEAWANGRRTRNLLDRPSVEPEVEALRCRYRRWRRVFTVALLVWMFGVAFAYFG